VARFLKEPSQLAGSQGHVCELDLMLEEYYRARLARWRGAGVKLEKLDIEYRAPAGPASAQNTL
jgi:hypothetical protein